MGGFNFMYIVILCCFLTCIHAQDDPVVDTKYGDVSGKSIVLASGRIIDSYLGIPFAKPPVDELRFTEPQEPDPWTGVFPAVDLGDACMQSLLSTVQLSHFGWTRYSEDCLHLNIYAPQRENPDELLPVMVWIHGGGYQGGANFIYPGYFLAERDVVVVSINYRLGIIGFAMTEDSLISGNMGLLDQILALRFVQENIEAFGGDPNQVTIFGESAGAGSVGLLMMSPLSEGLFHGSILQSGCELAGFAINRPIENPEYCLRDIASQLNCTTENTNDMVDCLREVNQRILINANCECPEGQQWCQFDPIIDGAIIPDLPRNLRERGEYMQVPEMIGVNDDDSYLFIAGEYPSLILRGLNRTMFDEIIWDDVYEASLNWPNPSRAEDVAKAIQFYYADWPYYEDPGRNRDMLGKLRTDEGFGYAADFQAKLHSLDLLPVYFYVYDYVPEGFIFPEWMGAFHGVEILLEFGWPFMYLEGNEMALNHSQVNNGVLNFTEADIEYSEFMITLWTNFAKYGDPTQEAVGGPNGTQVIWPQFGEDSLNYLHLKSNPETNINYRQKEYAFWTEYLQYLIYGTEFKEFQFPQFNFMSYENQLNSEWQDMLEEPDYNYVI